MRRTTRLVACSGVSIGLVFAALPTATAAPGQFTVTGSGWGHGVGMPQWGAYQQAVEGRSESQILATYYQGTALAQLPDNRTIFVNVAYRVSGASVAPQALESTPATMAVISAGGSGAIVSSSVTRVALLPTNSTVVARLWSRGTLVGIVRGPRVVLRWSGNRVSGPAGRSPAAVRVARNSAGSAWTSGLYRDGQLTVSAAGSRLNVVNYVRLHDEYLNGIAEVSASWPSAALKAQAITARSYALSKSKVRAACMCHVDDGTGPYFDQTFTGYARVTGAAGTRWSDAVSATAPSATMGTALTFNGAPIAAYYYASSGGRTANSEDVWGGRVAWARSVADPWSLRAVDNPDRSWRSVRSASSVAAAFGLPNVVSVAVTRRDMSGQMRTVEARAANGRTATLTGSQFGSRLGLRSLWVTSIG